MSSLTDMSAIQETNTIISIIIIIIIIIIFPMDLRYRSDPPLCAPAVNIIGKADWQ